jgi:hypothetical protein
VLHDRMVNHPVFAAISDLEGLRMFMEAHVLRFGISCRSSSGCNAI